jgi:hypothetical protein
MIILAIDPGTTQSGFCVWDGGNILNVGKVDHEDILDLIGFCRYKKDKGEEVYLYYEKLRAQGQRVGNETFDTLEWCGQYVMYARTLGLTLTGINRKDLVKHYPIIYTSKANPNPSDVDTQIFRCLCDRFPQIQKIGARTYWGSEPKEELMLTVPQVKDPVTGKKKGGGTDKKQAFALAVMMSDMMEEEVK